MKYHPDNIIGVKEIAKLGEVTPAAVVMWRKRALGFPTPIKELGCGPIFDKRDILDWLVKTRRHPIFGKRC